MPSGTNLQTRYQLTSAGDEVLEKMRGDRSAVQSRPANLATYAILSTLNTADSQDKPLAPREILMRANGLPSAYRDVASVSRLLIRLEEQGVVKET